MKKTIIIFALTGFVVFGGLCVKNVIAFSTHEETVKFNKDPKRANDQKVAEFKDTTTTITKIADAGIKVSSSANSDKSATSQGCCAKDNPGCCSSSPDKK